MKSYHDIQGDGGSRVVDQVAEKQARIRENLAGVRRLLAVGSGKGGVGKSTLTHHLAHALAARGSTTAILDADLNGPTQARLAGLPIAPPLPGKQGLALPRDAVGVGVISMGTLVPEMEALEFDSVARADSHTWRATREFSLLADLLETVEWGRLDQLLIDLPPGAERTFQYAEFFGPDTAFVLVTLPSELSRGVVARSRAALRGTPNRVLGYLENMAGYYCADCERIRPLFPGAADDRLDLPCLGSIPFDPELAERCDRGRGFLELPPGPVREAIHQAAQRIRELLEVA